MPRSLRGRLVAAFALLALTVLLVVGGTLFVVLRGLHQDATLGGLQDVAGSVLPQVRDSIGTGDLRGTVADVRDQLAARDIDVMLVGADGRLRPIGGNPEGDPILTSDLSVGETAKGSVTLNGQRLLYVAVGLRGVSAANPRAVAFLSADRSGALALADLGRTIPIVAIVVLLIATPLALALARSVTGPLRRLAQATTDIPAGRAAPLPLAGPSEVQELTGTFNGMTAELDATRRREDELLANLRHDLRTPLTVIAGFAAALRDGTAQGEAAVSAAQAIEEESARLERLVSEVGAVERIRSGAEAIRPELLDAGSIVQATATRFSARASTAGVRLTTDVPAGTTLTLAADHVALDRMLGNLVENALVALVGRQNGSIVIAVAEARLPNGTDALRFDVLDNGAGFPDGSAARAFERFWRADPARAGTGSGLGLSIVRELAVAHGGMASAENRTEGGARVSVTLPRVPWPAPGIVPAS